jgi:hypothetical protein
VTESNTNSALYELNRILFSISMRLGKPDRFDLHEPIMALRGFIQGLEDPDMFQAWNGKDDALLEAYGQAAGTPVGSSMLVCLSDIRHYDEMAPNSEKSDRVSTLYTDALCDALNLTWLDIPPSEAMTDGQQQELQNVLRACLRPPLEKRLGDISMEGLGDVLLETVCTVFYLLFFYRLADCSVLRASLDPLQNLLQAGIVPVGHTTAKESRQPPHCVAFRLNV